MKKILVWACMAFILCGVLAQIPSYAAVPVASYKISVPQYGVDTARYSTHAAVCGVMAAELSGKSYASNPSYKFTGEVVTTEPSCNTRVRNPSTGDAVVFGSSYIDGGLWCANGDGVSTQPVNGVCPDPPPVCTANKTYEATFQRGTERDGEVISDGGALPASLNGCVISVKAVVRCFVVAPAPGVIVPQYCTYKVAESGALSGATGDGPVTVPSGGKTGTDSPPTKVPAGASCPDGLVNMGTDSAGIPICGGSGTSPTVKSPPPTTTKPPVTVTNPDGSTTVTKVTERLNTDGSKTTVTETTVTAADGTSTVTKDTVTGAASNGATGKADATEDEKKSDFCKQNPFLNVCKNSSTSGACDTFATAGDAIQGAIAKQASDLNCRGKKADDDIKASAQYVLGNQILSGADPMASLYPTKANGSTFGMPSSLDNQGWLGGGSCFNDKSFTVQGKTIVIPFSSVCPYLVGLRYVLMVIAALVCFKMLSGVILRE